MSSKRERLRDNVKRQGKERHDEIQKVGIRQARQRERKEIKIQTWKRKRDSRKTERESVCYLEEKERQKREEDNASKVRKKERL